MSEDINDMNSSEKKISDSLDSHLRTVMTEKELKKFREQLPEQFLLDASEGLAEVKDTERLQTVLRNLNKQMHRQLAHQKLRARGRSIGDLSWTYWAIIIILLLIVVGYIVVHMFLSK
jgi:hypothetical protein